LGTFVSRRNRTNVPVRPVFDYFPNMQALTYALLTSEYY